MSEKKSTPAHLGEQKAPDITNIRYNDYTRTLLAEGIRIGALKHSDAEKMSSALLTVLTELLAEYLEREGITDELEFGAAAAELMQSLIFTIDTYLISLSDSALAMRQLKGVKDENVREMRRGGMAALRVLQCEALSLHAKAKKLVPPVKATVMRDALRSCHAMVLGYDREFMPAAPPNEPCYPLAVSFGLSGGIKYIRRYLRQLADENRFCKDVGTAVMRRFGKLLYEQRAEEDGRFCRNIYIPTLVSATICAYLKKSTKELILTQEDCELFCRLTKSFSEKASLLQPRYFSIIEIFTENSFSNTSAIFLTRSTKGSSYPSRNVLLHLSTAASTTSLGIIPRIQARTLRAAWFATAS